MITKTELENILICPVTHAKLSFLTDAERAELEQQIRSQAYGNAHMKDIALTMTDVLKANGHAIFYPVVDEIIFLLPHLAIKPVVENEPLPENEQTKNAITQFYNEVGWKQEAGIYQDARDSEDLRSVSSEYIEKCHLRINQYLPVQGHYLLDIACGPLQYEAYLSYSNNFTYRICADISLQALREAKKKLGDKGIYLLCDVTQLPLQENKIDGIISLHTLYHVPANEQALAFSELYRVLAPGGTSVIVYSWGHHSLFMNVLMFPFKACSWLKRRLQKPSGNSLYFHAYHYRWYQKEIKSKYPTTLFSWRSVNVPFLKTYIHSCLAGRQILKLIYWCENRFPQLMGRVGAYPLLVSKKDSESKI